MKRVISIFLIVLSVFSLSGCSRLFGRESEKVKPHLISYAQRETSPKRPIDSMASIHMVTDENDTLSLQQAELLEIVAVNMSRPSFNENQSQELKDIYSRAKKILDRYVKNDFTEFERVHAIHDYLTYHIEYDEGLYLRHISNPEEVSGEHDSFHLSGVFMKNIAVCDGFSKAFSFLCGMEGIQTEIIYGTYNYNGSYIPHSWNKVKIDNVWYNIDCTMDSINFYTDKDKVINVIHHGYFLLSDATVSSFGGHEYSGDSVGYPANTDYDFHSSANAFSETGAIIMQVNAQSELNDAFAYIKNSKRKHGQVELRLNMGLTNEQSNQKNAYKSQILEAYGLVKDKDFSFVPEKGMYPFQKYPRGVFVFLIYN